MHSSHTFTHLQLLSVAPNSLCLLPKDWLGKIPLSAGAPEPSRKGQQQLYSDKSACFSARTLFSISAFRQKASVNWLWLIYNIVKLCATKEDSNFSFKCNEMVFYVDDVRGTKLLAKKSKFKRRFACFCHSSEVRFLVSKVHMVRPAIDALKCLMSK